MKIGTRGSELALVQAHLVRNRLSQLSSEPLEVVIIKTQGDRVTDRPLRELPGRGFFTKEIEDALLSEAIDLAVHSLKDLPSRQVEGLELVAIPEREDPADLLVIRKEAYQRDDQDDTSRLIPLRPGATVGTSAVRRQVQLEGLRQDLRFRDLRGNVPTRLEKLRAGAYDAIFLAAAAANRLVLNPSDLEVVRLAPSRFVPAPGQGALAVQMRSNDPRKTLVREMLNHPATERSVLLERAVANRFGGGCSLPLGAFAEELEAQMRLHGFFGGDRPPKWAILEGPDATTLPEQLFNVLGGMP